MTETRPDPGRQPAEQPLQRGCWWTGALLVLLFSMPCVIPSVYWWAGRSDRELKLREARTAGDAHCMALWKLVQERARRDGALPQSLAELRGAPAPPAFVHEVHGGSWGQGRFYRIEYRFDDPSSLFGSRALRRRWSSRTERWSEEVVD